MFGRDRDYKTLVQLEFSYRSQRSRHTASFMNHVPTHHHRDHLSWGYSFPSKHEEALDLIKSYTHTHRFLQLSWERHFFFLPASLNSKTTSFLWPLQQIKNLMNERKFHSSEDQKYYLGQNQGVSMILFLPGVRTVSCPGQFCMVHDLAAIPLLFSRTPACLSQGAICA